jgi:hypothetical protein
VVAIAPNLDLATFGRRGLITPERYNIIVIDAGRFPAGPYVRTDATLGKGDGVGPVQHHAVLRGPCYVDLATLTAAGGGWFDGAIVVLEDGRALTERDVTGVLGVPVVATVPVDAAIARATDAGLLLRPSPPPPAAPPCRPRPRPTNALTNTPMQNVTDVSGGIR